MDRRGFLSFMGGAVLATPAMAQTAGGLLMPIPQKIIQDRLVIENLVLRGITIRNCEIFADGEYGIWIENCHVHTKEEPAIVAAERLRATGFLDLHSKNGPHRVLTTDITS